MSHLFQKQCRCQGTSSGPRLILSHAPDPWRPGVWILTASWVNLACDVCDKPWHNWIQLAPGTDLESATET